MSDFRKVAHLQEQLGKVGFEFLINSENTGLVKDFCFEHLLERENSQKGKITLNDRIYGHVSFCFQGERLCGYEVLTRVQKQGFKIDDLAGTEDAKFFSKNENLIPEEFREKNLVFIVANEQDALALVWDFIREKWVMESWDTGGSDWCQTDWILRRIM